MKGGAAAATQNSCSVVAFLTSRVPPVTGRHRPGSCSLFSFNRSPISSGMLKFPIISMRCNSSGDSAGENEFRSVLDAFFLGKAVGEALTERVESTVGEFLSTIGRLQAEQQKLVLEFQEEVLEKARRAKEQASWEALDAQELISKTSTTGVSAVKDVSETASSVAKSVISGASSAVPKPKDDPFFGLLDKE